MMDCIVDDVRLVKLQVMGKDMPLQVKAMDLRVANQDNLQVRATGPHRQTKAMAHPVAIRDNKATDLPVANHPARAMEDHREGNHPARAMEDHRAGNLRINILAALEAIILMDPHLADPHRVTHNPPVAPSDHDLPPSGSTPSCANGSRPLIAIIAEISPRLSCNRPWLTAIGPPSI
jgi:hypothetical protein